MTVRVQPTIPMGQPSTGAAISKVNTMGMALCIMRMAKSNTKAASWMGFMIKRALCIIRMAACFIKAISSRDSILEMEY